MREDERLRLMYYLGEGARLGRNEDDGQNYTTTKTAEAISKSPYEVGDGATAGTAMGKRTCGRY